MKKYLIFLITATLCLSALTGCFSPKETNTVANKIPANQEIITAESSSNFPHDPPALSVTDGKTAVSAWRGTYSWMTVNQDGIGSGIAADCMHPLDCKNELQALRITRKTTLTFHFDSPPKSITVRRYKYSTDGYDSYDEISVSGHTFDAKAGEHVYEVIAEWEDPEGAYSGTVYYAFRTEK